MFVEHEDEILHFLWRILKLSWFPDYLEQEVEEKATKINFREFT
jgi:hypothetical protein